MSREKFWVVLLRSGKTTRRYLSIQEAMAEAKRLTEIYGGQEFTVMESITTVKRSDTVWEPHDE